MDKFTLVPEDTVLMLIDIQEKLVLAMPYGQKVIQNANILITAADKLNIPIIVTEQYPKGLGKTVAQLSVNSDKVSVYEKITFNGCIEEVKTYLKQLNKRKILLAGMETHICVFQTVRELLALGYQVFVVGDAVCSRTKENYLNGLALMSAMGAVITNTETVAFDLIKEAGTLLFKEISKLVK